MNELVLLTSLCAVGIGSALFFNIPPAILKLLGLTFAISLSLSLYTCNQNSRERSRLIQEKKRADFVKDSILIELDAKIDSYFAYKDTMQIKIAIEKLIHTSDELSNYEKKGFSLKPFAFLKSPYLTYKEYWSNRRKERLEEYNDFVEGAFFDGWFD